MRTDEPVHKSATPESVEDRIQEIARSLGEYWGRACVNAWRTVFPKRETRR